MSQPLLSVLIPSRWRFDALIRSVKSWVENTRDISNLEILVRLHESDTDSIGRRLELLQFPNVVIHAGRDKTEGEGNNVLWNMLLPQAIGLWHQYWSDDMMIFDGGVHWDELLSEMPTEGAIVQPEIHRLGGSTYPPHEAGPVPFVPAGALPKLKYPLLLDPPDITIHEILSHAGWKTRFLKGVGVFHDRHEDRTLEK